MPLSFGGMRAMKAMYFLIFALGGSVVPFISLYFQQHGLRKDEIGYVQGVAAVAVVLSPILLTFLADSRLDGRKILAGAMLVAAGALGGLYLVSGFVATLVVWQMHMLAYVPLSTLQDGVTFSVMKRREEKRLPLVPYHRVRVWGSVGFMIPSVILFFVVKKTITPILAVGAGFGVLGAITAMILPNGERRGKGQGTRDKSRSPWPSPRSTEEREEEGVPGRGEKRSTGERGEEAEKEIGATKVESRVPTGEAARRMFRGPLLIFCLASFLLNAAQAPYYTYYAIYLKEKVRIGQEWVGLISNVGVVVEIFFMLGFAKLLGRWGLKKLMIVGAGCVAARMGLLALWPTPAVAVGTQLFHGMIVLALLVAPPVYLNQHAEDRYRHSMQGLYGMGVMGMGRIAGNLIAGPISRWSLPGVYGSVAVLSVVAIGLLGVAFYEEGHQKKEVVGDVEGEVGVIEGDLV
ncbi:MAG TPA: MFS transporter [Tepidisphaeraceae bacterium]|nr:MFS transporter [Tepidisphaeraceae bacterium]